MGSTAHVLVLGGPAGVIDQARARIAELEARWSRFRPDSEVSELNRTPGRLVLVSVDTFLLVERAVTAWGLTGGRFDPTVLRAVRAAGYDRSFDQLDADVPNAASESRAPAPGCEGIELWPELTGVWLPPGVELDPGGIGKGLAADLVTAELVDAGADGAMVNLGGDVRVRGTGPGGEWSLAVAHPDDAGRQLLRFAIPDGAVATSSRLRRRWTQGGRARHHLIDPLTGQPSASPLVMVTAITADAWWAEAVTKSVFVTGTPAPKAGVAGALVATVDADGRVELSPELAGLRAAA
jgi:thiamine biosynthesis lipoprotein